MAPARRCTLGHGQGFWGPPHGIHAHTVHAPRCPTIRWRGATVRGAACAALARARQRASAAGRERSGRPGDRGRILPRLARGASAGGSGRHPPVLILASWYSCHGPTYILAPARATQGRNLQFGGDDARWRSRQQSLAASQGALRRAPYALCARTRGCRSRNTPVGRGSVRFAPALAAHGACDAALGLLRVRRQCSSCTRAPRHCHKAPRRGLGGGAGLVILTSRPVVGLRD